MKTKCRYELNTMQKRKGWILLGNNSHIEDPLDLFIKPTMFGLFKWNKENIYTKETAISLHKKEVSIEDCTKQGLVCRPLEYL